MALGTVGLVVQTSKALEILVDGVIEALGALKSITQLTVGKQQRTFSAKMSG